MIATNGLIHATCVAIEGRGVLLSGRSGTGKSDLALRLIDRGAILVSDDYTFLSRSDDVVQAEAPERLAGLMEVRGLGILPMKTLGQVPVALLVDLEGPPDRLPELGETRRLQGCDIPAVRLVAYEASAPIKVEMALSRIVGE